MGLILRGHKEWKSSCAPSKADELSPDAQQALRDIVASILRRTGVGRGIPMPEAIDGTIELIERGFVVLEYNFFRQTYTLVPT